MILYSNINDAWGHTDDKEIYKNFENNKNKINYTTDDIPVKSNDQPIVENIVNTNPLPVDTNLKISPDLPVGKKAELEHFNNNIHNTDNVNHFVDHLHECAECKKKFKELFNINEFNINDFDINKFSVNEKFTQKQLIPINIFGLKFTMNRDIMVGIFIILIVLIILLLVSIFKNYKIQSSQKYLHNNMYLLPNDSNLFKLIQIP